MIVCFVDNDVIVDHHAIKTRKSNVEIHVLAWDRHKLSFVDISGIVDHHLLHFLFIISTISVI
jgi:hypothetical protein